MCAAAGFDAAVVTKEGGGNADADMALKMDALADLGIEAVGLYGEMAGIDGTGPSDDAEYQDVMKDSFVSRLAQELGNRQPPAVFELDQQPPGQDFLGEHPPLALGGHDAAADGRQLLLKFLVNVLLEPQAALQPPTPAGDF